MFGSQIAKTIALVLCPFLFVGFAEALTDVTSQRLPAYRLAAFCVGAALFILLWNRLRSRFTMLCTFEHEFTHLIFGLIFLKTPHSFVVTRRDGGHVTMSGGNFVITLAPYFFPTVSYVLLPLLFVIPPELVTALWGLLGASVAFHMVSTFAEVHWHQTDLHKAGILFSCVFLPVTNLMFYGAIFAMLVGGPKSFSGYWISGFSNAVHLPLRLGSFT